MRYFAERSVRLALAMAAMVVCATFTLYAQYSVLIGDRDQQRGVVRFNPANSTLSVFGSCSQQGSYRFYYGIDVHPQNGTVWVCDALAQQIVVLSHTGNCLSTISTSQYGTPVGISIHPSGSYAHITFQSNIIACYDIANQTWGPTTTVADAFGLYGLQWSQAGTLFVCDFYGQQLIALGGAANQPLTEMARTSTTYNPYDVAVITRTGGLAPIDHVYVTETTGSYGSNSRISSLGYAYDTPGYLPTPSLYLTHPQTGNGSVSFFGIVYAPQDNTLWVNDYVRGELYQVTVGSNPTATLRYDEPSPYKYGLGVAIVPRCVESNGDINLDCRVDDADLLIVLFNFGQTGFAVQGDVNCDGAVDDSDLLIVLFNFGWHGGDMC